MTPDEERDAMWKALLAAVNELTRRQPGAYEYGQKGSGWWAVPHGTSRSPAIHDNNRTAVIFEVWQADGSAKHYHLQIIFAGIEGGERDG